MALLYDKAHLQNLVIIGFHVLNRTETSKKQKTKFRQLITLGRSPALIIIIAWWKCQLPNGHISLS